ncbi:MAG: hypothetical protein ACXVAE_04730, partial [Candidatus Limnocylindrales bacterium]
MIRSLARRSLVALAVLALAACGTGQTTGEPTPTGAYFHDLVSCCSRKTLVQRFGPSFNRPGCFELLMGAVA